jgi:hypothetical protein
MMKLQCMSCKHQQEAKPMLGQSTNYKCEACDYRCYTFAEEAPKSMTELSNKIIDMYEIEIRNNIDFAFFEAEEVAQRENIADFDLFCKHLEVELTKRGIE